MNIVIGAARRTRDFCLKYRAYILSFLIPAALLFVSYMLFGVYPFGERSVLALDLNAQYVYYYDYMYDVFAGRESLFYCWSRTFSGEFFGLFAYYLASPFNVIVWLFPRTAITEGLLTMLLVKAAAGGLTCACLLKARRGFSDYTAALFSVMYALSGYFAGHSINPMWLDGMIALPLVIIGVERVCDKKRFLLYTLSLFFIFVANYYIGYMVGIFSALYFVYYIASGRTAEPSAKGVGKSVLVYGASSVSAILMSGFIILPAYKSLQMGKLDFGEPDFSPAENFNLTDALLKLFAGTFDTIRPEGLPMLYCGTLALIFAVIYFTVRRIPLRRRISGGALLAVILLSMYIKPVDMLWHGGQVPVWMPYRYSFIAVFLLVMFGAEAFENIRHVKLKTIGGVFVALLGLLLVADHYAGSEHFNTTLVILIPLIVLGVVAAAAAFFRKYSQRRYMRVTLAVIVCAELLVNDLVTFHRMNDDIYYSSRESYLGDIPKTRETVNLVKELDGGFYRMEKTYHRCVNDDMAVGIYGLSHSSSTFNKKAIALAKTLGYGAREHYSRYDGATLLTDDILGIKYVLSQRDVLSQYDNRLSIPTNGDIKVYTNDDAPGLVYLAERDAVGVEMKDMSPFAAQERLAARISGVSDRIYLPITEYTTQPVNLNAGSTTDNHLSYKKRLADDPAYVSYSLTTARGGAAYMYLPTVYERECRLYVNGEFIKYYFENENHSIAYLGRFEAGESFEVKLELCGSDVYYERPQFYTLNETALQSFNDTVSALNADTAVTRTGNAKLSVSVNAERELALFTSIPFEEGWTVTIDGVKVPILKTANDTFMCVEVPSGEHKIELSFAPAGMKTGLILTLAGAVILAAMIAVSRLVKSPRARLTDDNDDNEEYGEEDDDG